MREVIIGILSAEEMNAETKFSENENVYKAEFPSMYQNMGELIRCKDCKHMVEHKGYGYLGESAYTCEGNMDGWIYPTSFCSSAERKEE